MKKPRSRQKCVRQMLNYEHRENVKKRKKKHYILCNDGGGYVVDEMRELEQAKSRS